MHTRLCERERLAGGDLAMVELCTCGAAHLTIGALTVRLAPAAVGELATILGDAARELALLEVVETRRTAARQAVS